MDNQVGARNLGLPVCLYLIIIMVTVAWLVLRWISRHTIHSCTFCVPHGTIARWSYFVTVPRQGIQSSLGTWRDLIIWHRQLIVYQLPVRSRGTHCPPPYNGLPNSRDHFPRDCTCHQQLLGTKERDGIIISTSLVKK